MSLRPYQQHAIQRLRFGYRSGHRCQVLQLATGGGKTHIASHLLSTSTARGRRAYFVVDRLPLVEQAANMFHGHGMKVGIVQANHPGYDPDALVQVATVQTLARRPMPDMAFCIIDECFVEGTRISTPSGDVPIEIVRCGDTVHNAMGCGTVTAVHTQTSRHLIELEFSDGTITRCTENHPFFTPAGWVNAAFMEVGAITFRIEGVQGLRRTVQGFSEAQLGWIDDGARRKVMASARVLFNLLREESEESHAPASRKGEGFDELVSDRSPPESSWWQRATDATGAESRTDETWDGLGFGAHRQGREGSWGWLAYALQDRRSEPEGDDSHRGGRGFALLDSEEDAGLEEGCFFGLGRVVRVSRIEQESPVVVRNLQISGHPSYYADGSLVHNCHVLHKHHQLLIEKYSDVPFIGLSATPWADGLGKHFSNLVVGATTAELIQSGDLVPYHAYAPSDPDLTGVKTVGGDYQKAQLGEAMDKPQIVGDVVDHWIRHGEHRQTLIFAVNIAHSKHLVHEFQVRGINAEHIDAYTDSDERRRLIDGFKAGDITALSSVGVLTTGFDAPNASCLVIARPTKSLMLHIQMLGRGLRTCEGKSDCLVLDHAGNTLRLGLPDDPMPDVLDMGDKKAAKSKSKRDEPLPKACSKCMYLKPARVRTCPACGHEPEYRQDVDTVEGELVSVTKRNRTWTWADKTRWAAMLKGYGLTKHYAEGWWRHKYQEQFGVWPNDPRVKNAKPLEPDTEVRSWIKHKQIQWAKRKKAAAQ